MLELGWKVRDRVTGFEGIVMALTQWLTGCDQAGVKPLGLDKDGKTRDMEWFDLSRLEVTEECDLARWGGWVRGPDKRLNRVYDPDQLPPAGSSIKARLNWAETISGRLTLKGFFEELSNSHPGFNQSYESVRYYHRGGNQPPVDYLVAVADVFNLDLGWLITGRGSPSGSAHGEPTVPLPPTTADPPQASSPGGPRESQPSEQRIS